MMSEPTSEVARGPQSDWHPIKLVTIDHTKMKLHKAVHLSYYKLFQQFNQSKPQVPERIFLLFLSYVTFNLGLVRLSTTEHGLQLRLLMGVVANYGQFKVFNDRSHAPGHAPWWVWHLLSGTSVYFKIFKHFFKFLLTATPPGGCGTY